MGLLGCLAQGVVSQMKGLLTRAPPAPIEQPLEQPAGSRGGQLRAIPPAAVTKHPLGRPSPKWPTRGIGCGERAATAYRRSHPLCRAPPEAQGVPLDGGIGKEGSTSLLECLEGPAVAGP